MLESEIGKIENKNNYDTLGILSNIKEKKVLRTDLMIELKKDII